MKHKTTQVINASNIVGSWLKNHGYGRVSLLDNSRIEADSNMRSIVVQVTSTKPTRTEAKKMFSEMTNNREAWIAIITQENASTIEWIDITSF